VTQHVVAKGKTRGRKLRIAKEKKRRKRNWKKCNEKDTGCTTRIWRGRREGKEGIPCVEKKRKPEGAAHGGGAGRWEGGVSLVEKGEGCFGILEVQLRTGFCRAPTKKKRNQKRKKKRKKKGEARRYACEEHNMPTLE